MKLDQPAWKLRFAAASQVAAATDVPSNAYAAEDGTTPYVAEDGTTFYVQE